MPKITIEKFRAVKMDAELDVLSPFYEIAKRHEVSPTTVSLIFRSDSYEDYRKTVKRNLRSLSPASRSCDYMGIVVVVLAIVIQLLILYIKFYGSK